MFGICSQKLLFELLFYGHPMSTPTSQAVHAHYSSLARSDPKANTTHIQKVAESFGYTPEDLAGIPSGANLGVSCGNPFAIAGIKPVGTLMSKNIRKPSD